MNRKIILPSMLALTVFTLVMVGTQTVSAQDKYPTIIERLANRFNLDRDEVQSVFAEVKDERKADMYANWAERLDDLVAEGKITESQKQAILDKHEEMQAKMDGLKDLGPQERKVKMRELHEEIKTWAKEQGINFPVMAFKFGFHKGFRAGYFSEKLD